MGMFPNWMSYEDAKVAQAKMYKMQDECTANMKAKRAELATKLGIEERGPMGLTPDEIKFHPEYSVLTRRYNMIQDEIRHFNKGFMKKFKYEYTQERRAKYEERTKK